MIEKIILENFQSHKHSELDLAPGVNVIVGPSDSGKTAIIRALRWLVWNRPLGDAYINYKSKQCKVELKVDGHRLGREKERKNGRNVYFLDGNYFNAIGTDPPDEIERFLNLQDINLQQQFDRPFLLDSSPGEVAQHFNRVARLDMIDVGMKRILQWIRRIQQDISAKENQIETLEKELLNYDYLPLLEGRIQSLEQMQSAYVEKKGQKDSIEELSEHICQVDAEIAELTKAVSVEEKVNSILSTIDKKKQKYQDALAITQLFEKLSEIEEELLKQTKLVEAERQVDAILEKINRKERLEDEKEKLKNLVSNISKTDQELAKQKERTEKLEKTYHNAFPDICPLCGQKVRRRG